MLRKFQALFILTLLTNCGASEPSGIELPHSELLSTVIWYDNFTIHTYTNDTLFRNCGYELTLEPKDSSDSYNYISKNARLLKNQENNYQFVIEAQDDPAELLIIRNNKDSTFIKFKSPFLPKPTLTKSVKNDSIVISVVFIDPRIGSLLPYDTRYQLSYHGQLYNSITLHKDQQQTTQLEVIRVNYRNKKIPIIL
ncbi:hypothetical protein SAMN05421640_0007 [Ekhidna lutea]|uniref:Uncharacterized protein n=1 Tax=Ekhidna lutea TaxID=447679 RepID=A0A239MEU3_EKHLU|nr:hypothetical protein [Ekhidna lutea]SNT40624.1 hypothetical protein SAMN05421640_0007 [Ekhidna lutea]